MDPPTARQAVKDSPQTRAFQDYYPDDLAHCFGCGRLNERGHRLRSRWDPESRDEAVARFTPQPHHTAVPGIVYGGLVASLVDCHATGTAAALAARRAGWELGRDDVPEGEVPRFVTASLKVDYRRPTPLGPELEIRSRVEEAGARKVVVKVTVAAAGEVTAEGTVVAVRMPEGFAGA